jgi:hypothetical protein
MIDSELLQDCSTLLSDGKVGFGTEQDYDVHVNWPEAQVIQGAEGIIFAIDPTI